MNPDTGFESRGPAPPAQRPRYVVVVGAGPAGLEAARTAAARGHKVEIYEQKEAVGGLVRAARAAPYRQEIGVICDFLERELARLGVPIRLGEHADAGLIERLGPDAVITATGSLPRLDGVQRLRPGLRPSGLDLAHVVDPVLVLEGRVPKPREVVVFDDIGHYPAIGAAERLLEDGANVTFASSLATLGTELVKSFQRDPVAARLGSYEGFSLIGRTSLLAVTETHVTLRALDGGRETTVPADLLVLATSFESQTSLYRQLVETGWETYLAGDAVAPLLMQHAIASGRSVGLAV